MDYALVDDGHLIVFSSVNDCETKNFAVLAKIWTLNVNQEWVESRPIVFQIKTKVKSVEILSVNRCSEFLTEFTIPVVLVSVQSRSSQSTLYLLGLNLRREIFVPLRKFDSVTVDSTKCNKFVINDGPCLIWANTTSIVYSPSVVNHHIPNSSLIEICNSVENPEILWTGSIDEWVVFIIKLKTTKLCMQQKTSRETETVDSVAYVHKDTNDGSSVMKEIDTACFYPKEYTNIIYIHVDNFSIQTDEKGGFISCCMCLYALTYEGNLLKFDNGKLKFAMPVREAKSVQGAEVQVGIEKLKPFASKETLLTVRIGSDVFVISEDHKKICHTWTGVSQTLCGSFLHQGGDEVLVFTENFDGKVGWALYVHNAVVINNLINCSPNVQIEQKSRDDSSDKGDNSETAVDALQARLHNEMVLCCEKERDLDTKAKFIVNTWERLVNDDKGRQLPMSKPPLVTLFGKKQVHPFACVSTNATGDTGKKVKVTDTWQRVVGDKWIVGVDISSSVLITAQLSVIPEKDACQQTGGLVCLSHGSQCDLDLQRSKQDTLSTKSKSILPDPKKIRLSVDENSASVCPPFSCSVFCKLKLPRFGHHSELKCHLVLDWADEPSETRSDSTSHREGCGVVCLTVDDVINQTFHVKTADEIFKENTRKTTPMSLKEVRRDISALEMAQVCTPLKMTSITSKVSNVKEWLERWTDYRHSAVYKCYLMPNSGPMCGTRLMLDQTLGLQKHLIHFKLYTRDEDQTMLAVHHLYSCFPDDILILLDKSSSDSKALRNLSPKLEEELTFLTSSLRELRKRNRKQTLPVEHELDARGHVNVDLVRDNYQKRKRELTEDLAVDGDSDNIQKLFEKLTVLQLQTDEQVINL